MLGGTSSFVGAEADDVLYGMIFGICLRPPVVDSSNGPSTS